MGAVSIMTSQIGSLAFSRLSRHFADSKVPFEVIMPSGESHKFGKGQPSFTVTLKNRRAIKALVSLDEGNVGEAFLDGSIEITGDMLRPFELRGTLSDAHPLTTIWRFLQPLVLGQVSTNRRAIADHYDIDADFFLSFLDPEIPMYTQGVYVQESESLAAATRRKFDWCIEQCRLKSGDRVLEIGPGWGGFAEYAFKRGIHLTGITISSYSRDFLNKLKERTGGDWDIQLVDFLEYQPKAEFDAIVIMGVIEHIPDYKAVLERFSRWVKPGGRIFLDGSAATKKYELSSFMVRHIYGGNHSFLVLHDFLDKLASTPLKLVECYNDRDSYFYTFRQWAINFDANRDKVVARFGEFNFRRFQLYLWGAAYEFFSGSLDCYRMIIERPIYGDGRSA